MCLCSVSNTYHDRKQPLPLKAFHGEEKLNDVALMEARLWTNTEIYSFSHKVESLNIIKIDPRVMRSV